MTDLRSSQLVRETLDTSTPNLRSSQLVRETLDTSTPNLLAAGAVREALLTDINNPFLHVAGMARETLLLDPAINNLHVAQVVRETLLADATSNLGLLYLNVVQIPTSDDRDLSLRWSDDGGASWSDTRIQTIGDVGEYETNIQFLQLGMSRNRVVELSWTGQFPTALTGIFVRYTMAQT